MAAKDERARVSAEARESSEPAAPTAEQLGRYELCGELATGGMATVYLARTVGQGGFVRICAVKRIHPHLAKRRAFLDMLLDEARTAARIDHPNVCQVFDVGRTSQGAFLAMEYLAGETLSRVMARIASGAAPEWLDRFSGLAAAIVAEACDGLHAAHELAGADGAPLNVVHRDVSPQNLFVTFTGATKVIDFGIASAKGKIHETETDELKGKAAYMAPEQIESSKVDRRADVWALGVVLWELLTIKRLFKRDSASATIRAVEREPIVPPSRFRPEIRSALDAIVLRALERDPERRYASAAELGRDLRAIAREEGRLERDQVAAWMLALFPEGPPRERERRAIAEVGLACEPPVASGEDGARSERRTKRSARSGAPARWIATALIAALAASGAVALLVAPSTPDPERAARSESSGPQRQGAPRSPMPVQPTGAELRAAQPAPTDSSAPPVRSEVGPHRTGEPAEPVALERSARPPRRRAEASELERAPTAAPDEERRAERVPAPPHTEDGMHPPDGTASEGAREPAEPGCLRIASQLAVQLDGHAWLEGPLRCAPAAVGLHRVALYELDRSRLLGERSIELRPGESVAITRP